MPTYWVTLEAPAYKTLLVQAEDEQEARRLALAQDPLAMWSDWEPSVSATPKVVNVEED